MSKKLAKLQKQAAEIQAQIEREEMAEKNRSRTERLTLKVLKKYPDLFLCDPAVLETNLDSSFAAIVVCLKDKAE